MLAVIELKKFRVQPLIVIDKITRCTYFGQLGAIGVNDKEHKRNLRRLAKAIEASNEMLRKAGIQVRGAEQPIHVPEQKPEIRSRATK